MASNPPRFCVYGNDDDVVKEVSSMINNVQNQISSEVSFIEAYVIGRVEDIEKNAVKIDMTMFR